MPEIDYNAERKRLAAEFAATLEPLAIKYKKCVRAAFAANKQPDWFSDSPTLTLAEGVGIEIILTPPDSTGYKVGDKWVRLGPRGRERNCISSFGQQSRSVARALIAQSWIKSAPSLMSLNVGPLHPNSAHHGSYWLMNRCDPRPRSIGYLSPGPQAPLLRLVMNARSFARPAAPASSLKRSRPIGS